MRTGWNTGSYIYWVVTICHVLSALHRDLVLMYLLCGIYLFCPFGNKESKVPKVAQLVEAHVTGAVISTIGRNPGRQIPLEGIQGQHWFPLLGLWCTEFLLCHHAGIPLFPGTLGSMEDVGERGRGLWGLKHLEFTPVYDPLMCSLLNINIYHHSMTERASTFPQLDWTLDRLLTLGPDLPFLRAFTLHKLQLYILSLLPLRCELLKIFLPVLQPRNAILKDSGHILWYVIKGDSISIS